MGQDLAWINGEISPAEEARVPFLDHGYLFGFGVYETMKTYGGKLFALKEHFDRLEQSMHALEIKPELSREKLRHILEDLVAQAAHDTESFVYLQVTRGPGPRHEIRLPSARPTVGIFVTAMPLLAEEVRRRGVTAISLPDERWRNPHMKTLNLLPNMLAKMKAQTAGAYEAIFYKEEGGLVTEGASSNVFAVCGQTVVTPPADGRILQGVTRLRLLQSAAKRGIIIREKSITLDELRRADEIFISSTGVEALGISTLDEVTIGDGQAGPMSLKLYTWFMEDIAEELGE